MTTNKQLRELARKATVGPWWIDSHGHRMSANGGLDTVFIADDRMGPAARHPETGNLSHWPNDWDASYIAAANPERVLALLDEIESLQAECEKLQTSIKQALIIAGRGRNATIIQRGNVLAQVEAHLNKAMQETSHDNQ